MQVNEYKESAHIGLAILLAMLVGFFIMFNPKLGVILALLPVIIYCMLIDKKNALLLLLAFTPFHASPFIDQNLLGIPGAKPYSLFAVLTFIIFYYHGGQLFIHHNESRRKVTIYLGLYFAFFSLAIFRSLDHFQLLNMVSLIRVESSSSYLLSYYVKPSLYLVSFIYILNHITTEKDIERIFAFLSMVTGMLSIAIILIVLFHGDILTETRTGSVKYWSTYLGSHYNDIGTIYIILGPLVFVPALRKNFWGMLNWCLALIALVLLQSRTALLVFILGCVIMLFFLGRKKELIFLSSLLFLFSLYYLPEFLMKTLQTGLESGDLNEVFTGRIDDIWMPLLSEWFNDTKLFLFGTGRFAMMSSAVYRIGIIEQTGHPHNAFIQVFLDNGIILFLGFVLLLIKLLKSAWLNIRKINSDIGWALLVSIICYLVSCFSGRSFYPTDENTFLFAIIALLVNYLILHTTSTGDYAEAVVKDAEFVQ
jgi:O-antigen ligase